MISQSTWFEGLGEMIEGKISNILTNCAIGLYNSMFVNINKEINGAGGFISQSPTEWSSGTFNMIQSISENVIFPIAGIIITYIFAYELINLVTESNSMKTITPKEVMLVIVKALVAIIVLSKGFRIVMAFFEMGNHITRNLTAGNVNVGSTVDISDALANESAWSLMGVVALLVLAWLLVYILTIFIYIAINAWFLEIFIYSSAAAIPFATFLNKEWGQIGMNYTRKIMALAFQSFFMLLCMMIYSARLSDVATGDLTNKLIEIVGGGAVLVFTLFKCGNISASIFNAH